MLLCSWETPHVGGLLAGAGGCGSSKVKSISLWSQARVGNVNTCSLCYHLVGAYAMGTMQTYKLTCSFDLAGAHAMGMASSQKFAS